MFSTLKKIAGNADELEDLLTRARSERAALNTALSQVTVQSNRLSEIESALGDLLKRVTTATARVDAVTTRASQAESRLVQVEDLGGRVRAVDDTLTQAERRLAKLSSPGGDLQPQGSCAAREIGRLPSVEHGVGYRKRPLVDLGRGQQCIDRGGNQEARAARVTPQHQVFSFPADRGQHLSRGGTEGEHRPLGVCIRHGDVQHRPHARPEEVGPHQAA